MDYDNMIAQAITAAIGSWQTLNLTAIEGLAEADRIYMRQNNLELAAACSAMTEEHYNSALMG